MGLLRAPREGKRLRPAGAGLASLCIALLCIGALLAGCAATGSARPGAESRLTTGQTSTTPFVYMDNDIFATTRSYNFFSPDFPYQAEYFSVLPLATQTSQTLSSYIPEVAESWQLHGQQLVVHLRHLRWQDGRPVTSRDVVDSFLLSGVAATGVWQDLTQIQAPNASEVVFSLAPHVATVIAESLVLGTFIVPASEYARFVTPGLAKTVAQYYDLVRSNPSAAPNSGPGRAVNRDLQTLEKFQPPRIIGDGPFIWKNWTTSDALLVKSPTFYDAKRIHVPEFEFEEVATPVNEGAVTDGTSAIDTAGLPKSIYQKVLRTPNQHVYFPPGYTEQNLGFNSRHFPLNLVQVRQAIVYIIHRPQLIALVYGKKFSYHFVKYPSLVYYLAQPKYLTKSQIDSLNSYPYDPAKATSLLDSVGFHRKDGQWYLPDGKRFTLTIDAPSGFSNVILDYKVFATWLTKFGIKTTEVTSDEASYTSDMLQGQFELGQEYIGGYLDPLQFMAAALGTANDYISGGANKGDPGIGFGPTMTVPGLGKVNVPDTIQAEADQVGPGPEMNKLVWDWARLVNKQLPMFSFGDRHYPLAFSTAHYVDWPPKSSSVLWILEAMNNHAGLVAMMERGYLRPRR